MTVDAIGVPADPVMTSVELGTFPLYVTGDVGAAGTIVDATGVPAGPVTIKVELGALLAAGPELAGIGITVDATG